MPRVSCQAETAHAWSEPTSTQVNDRADQLGSPGVEPGLKPEEGSKPEPKEDKAAAATITGTAGFLPRLTCDVPSLHSVVTSLRNSRSGAMVSGLTAIMTDMATATADGLDQSQIEAVVDLIKSWSDAAVTVMTFAPDCEGRARWAFRLDWPLSTLSHHVRSLLESEAAHELFEEVTLGRRSEEGYVLRLADQPLAYLVPDKGGKGSVITSHVDLALPPTTVAESTAAGSNFAKILENADSAIAGSTEATAGSAVSDRDQITCRLGLVGTEPDSGATFFSSFSAVSAIHYQARVTKDGTWDERGGLSWPAISGVGAKVFLGRVKHSFFVPEESFGAVAISSAMAAGMLDGLCGFGPQVTMGESGAMEIIGDADSAPLSSRVSSDLCVTLLPGTGFLPVPDVVVQTRTRAVGRFADDLRKVTDRINEEYRKREQTGPWHEITVRGRTVFHSEGGAGRGGMIMPFTMHPVLFNTREVDAGGRERDYLVAALTSTAPEPFVRRWLDLPRSTKTVRLPTAKKTDGQLWVNWRVLYRWIRPYADASLSLATLNSMMPGDQTISESLVPSTVTADVNYSGLTLNHRGPLPLGVIVVPSLFAASLEPDDSGGSDLARERLAAQRLRVFHHHAQLFRKDIGRWPAELDELDGYVDFTGNPRLLRLDLSPRRRWRQWLDDVFESDKSTDRSEDGDDDLEDVESRIDDELFVINWRRESWSLGLAPGTLEHLDRLYIDEFGEIHRVPRDPEKPSVDAERDDRATDVDQGNPTVATDTTIPSEKE